MSIYGPQRNLQKASDVDSSSTEYAQKSELNAVVNSVVHSLSARKQVITIWAEENSIVETGKYEWSFGNGAGGQDHALSGYTMMTSGRIIRMGLSASTSHSNNTEEDTRLIDTVPVSPITVNIVVNGHVNPAYSVTKPAGQYSGTRAFTTPLEIAQGDRLNFQSATTDHRATSAIVCVLIELDGI